MASFIQKYLGYLQFTHKIEGSVVYQRHIFIFKAKAQGSRYEEEPCHWMFKQWYNKLFDHWMALQILYVVFEIGNIFIIFLIYTLSHTCMQPTHKSL